MYIGNLSRGTIESAGYDLSADNNYIIPVGKRQLINTGVYLQLEKNTFGLIKSRSGLSCKGIDVGAGVIDSDYRGEIKVLLINNGEDEFAIYKGMRIAQIIILPYLSINSTTSFAGGTGGTGGTGSTDGEAIATSTTSEAGGKAGHHAGFGSTGY